MNIKLIPINEKIKEKQFSDFIEKLGYKCKKLTINSSSTIMDILKIKFEVCAGMPDFLIYNDKEKFLCEFKSLTDSWSLHQIEWIIKNQHIPFAFAFVTLKKDLEVSKNKEKIEFDTDFEETMRIINISWRYKELYLEEYLKLNPEIIGKEIFEYNGGYLGAIPFQVSEKYKIFDQIFFKDKQRQKELIDFYEENKQDKNKLIILLP